MSSRSRFFKSTIIERQTVTVYEKPNEKIFLLGTNHVNKQSTKAIKKLIALVDPDIVAVELCLERLQNANVFGDREAYEKKYRDLIHIPMRWRRKAAAEMTRLLIARRAMEGDREIHSNRDTRRFKVKPIDIDGLTIAGDVFTPFRDYVWTLEPNKTGLSCAEADYKIVLADAPISETCAKLATVFGDEEKEIVRKYKDDFVRVFSSNTDGLMSRIWYQNDDIRRIMIDQRNEYLSQSILNAKQFIKNIDGSRVSIVAVVGRRHVDGILEIWRSTKNS